MARVNVYLPDELAEQARDAGLNMSRIVQQVLRHELARHRTDEWLAQVERLPPTGVSHEKALNALDAAREEMFGEARG